MIDTNTSTILTASAVRNATNLVSREHKIALLGYGFEGDFVQSPSISSEVSTPTSDNKLWIIGAVLGPIAFVLLLVGLACFLHRKYRRRSVMLNRADVCV